ncbi:MAG TPA: hypothetical protein VF275_05590 [Gammaproteobacteria bacterium]
MVKTSEEIAFDIAAAKLEVAERLGWPLAIVSGLFIAIYSHWLIGAGAGIAAYLLAVKPYTQKYDAASDTFERVTGTGRYYSPPD